MQTGTTQDTNQSLLVNYAAELRNQVKNCATKKPLLQKNEAFRQFITKSQSLIDRGHQQVEVAVIYFEEQEHEHDPEVITIESTQFAITHFNHQVISKKDNRLKNACIQLIADGNQVGSKLFKQTVIKKLPQPLIRKSLSRTADLSETLKKALIAHLVSIKGIENVNGQLTADEIDHQLLKSLENWQLAHLIASAYQEFEASYGVQSADKTRAFGKPAHIARLTTKLNELKSTQRSLEQFNKEGFEDAWRSKQFDEQIRGRLELELKELLGFERKKVGSAYRLVIPETELNRTKDAIKDELSDVKLFINGQATSTKKAYEGAVNEWLNQENLDPLKGLPEHTENPVATIETRIDKLQIDYEGKVMDQGASQFISSVRKPFMLILIMGSMFGFSLSTFKNSEYFFMVLIALLFVGTISAIRTQTNNHIDMMAKELKNARMAIEREMLQIVNQGINLAKGNLQRYITHVGEASLRQAEEQATTLELELHILHHEMSEIEHIKEECALQPDNPLSRLMSKNKR